MERLFPWFRLKQVPGIGNSLFKRLLEHFSSPERVFNADINDLAKVDGISRHMAETILGRQDSAISKELEKELEILEKKGYRIHTILDSEYPRLLREIPDPPPLLYVHGILDEDNPAIAVVGCRNASAYGIMTGTRLAMDLASLNITVVSGMAMGIDTAAHNGAMKGKGKTVAVLGSGLENIYPPENRELFHKIAQNGAIISEFPLFSRPEAHHFPIRNRIISGMTLGSVIIEAGKKSGALITARYALEQGREVFAVPGSIHSFKSIGPHSLIKQGAKLVETVRDITEEFPEFSATGDNTEKQKTLPVNKPPPLEPEESTVFNALSSYPIHIDDLVRNLTMEPSKISGILLKLELKGIVTQSPGKLFFKNPGL